VKTYETSYGPVPVWGEFDRFESYRPLLFVIRGAFPDLDSMTLLYRHLPEFDVALVHLPGMHSPFFSECSVNVFARAFDEVVVALDKRKIFALGLSTGALVALAMRGAESLILVEPPLSTADAWPLIPQFLEWGANNSDVARWIDEIFGYSEQGVVNRDYTGLLENSSPGVVLLGGAPLEPRRPFDRMPSLVTQADRARIAATPHLKAIVLPGVGHNVPFRAPKEFLVILKQALADSAYVASTSRV